MKWVSNRQRLFVIIAIREGRIQVPYRRRHSGGLAGAWVEKVERRGDSLIGQVDNRISYGPFVMGPDSQAAYHQGNWPTTVDVLNKVKGDIKRYFETAIRKAVK